MGNGRYTRDGKIRAGKIREILERNGDGLTQWQLVMELGMKEGARLESQLASLEKHGVIVSEDERGRLYLFEERGLYAVGE